MKDEPTKLETFQWAAEAVVRWFDAEAHNLGSFHDKMDLCKFAEWATRKALGEDNGDFVGVPRLVIKMGLAARPQKR